MILLRLTCHYEYNSFNQLIKVRGNNSQGTVIEEYLYDGNNQRLMKVSYLGNNTNNTEYYFDETFVKRINSTGVFNEEYVYHDSTLIAAIKPDGTKEFSHPDHLGSTTLITNFSGNLVEETTYYPFGSVFEGGNSRYTYTGKEIDSTGLSYYGARYYSADILRRFTQADTLILDIYNPQALNRYSYVLNNPYKYTDPSGNEPIKSELIGVNKIISQIKQIEANNPNLNARQVLNVYASNYKSPSNSQGSAKGFIWTSEKGFIDTQHFFVNAKYGSFATQASGSEMVGFLVSEANAIGVGYAFEGLQSRGIGGGKESFLSYEDIRSNIQGGAVGAFINSESSASAQISSYLYGIGGSDNPHADIPPSIYSTLPNDRDSATRGAYLSNDKRSGNLFGKAVPKNSWWDKIKNKFGKK